MNIQPQEFVQTSLFADETTIQRSMHRLILPNGENMPNADIVIYERFFDETDSHRLFSELLVGVEWRQDSMKLYGKEINLPRQTAWYGEVDKDYTFSGITMHPAPWNHLLAYIKEKVEKVASCQFNSVLLNHYRSGNDSISWHTDAEPELGINRIFSIIRGEPRHRQTGSDACVCICRACAPRHLRVS